MNYGLYLSASGVLTNLYRQDVYASNLANVETSGFKPYEPAIRQREPESVEDLLGHDVSHRLLDRLGGGALAGPQRIIFDRAPLRHTKNPLDVAVEGKDTFFAVRYQGPDTSKSGCAPDPGWRFRTQRKRKPSHSGGFSGSGRQ